MPINNNTIKVNSDHNIISFNGEEFNLYSILTKLVNSARNPQVKNVLLHAFVRYHDFQNRVLVFERPPEQRIIFFRDKHYMLMLPWTIYFLKYNTDDIDIKIYFNAHSLEELNEPLNFSSLPNVSSTNSSVCFAKTSYKEENIKFNFIQTTKNTNQLIEFVFDRFWFSKFNEHFDLNTDTLPTFVPTDVVDGIKAEPSKLKQWELWLEWWEDNVDLATAIKWNTNNKTNLTLPETISLTADSSPEESSQAVYKLLTSLANEKG